MRNIKRLAVIALAIATVFVGIAPATASPTRTETATTIAFSGTIQTGSNLSSGSSVAVNVGGPCGTAAVGTSPDAGGGLCAVALSGSAGGTCAVWSGQVQGTAWSHQLEVGESARYSVTATIVAVGNVVEISGQAVAPNGDVKVVAGGGVAYEDSGDSLCLNRPNGAHRYVFAGSLTIAL